jgi:hypothetical protein
VYLSENYHYYKYLTVREMKKKKKLQKRSFPKTLDYQGEFLIYNFWSNTFSNGMGSREGSSRQLRQ